MDTKTIHVSAFEHVHVWRDPRGKRLAPAGAGFNFWQGSKQNETECDWIYGIGYYLALNTSESNVADFRFDVQVPKRATVDQIRILIDSQLVELIAASKRKRVGANVREYWKRNRMDAGDIAKIAKKARAAEACAA